MTTHRPTRTLRAQPTEDGAGVKIRRVHDFSGSLDPFLLLDELKSSAREDYVGGFPAHPHRGFETLTYLLKGGLTHEDSMGNRSTVQAGEAQWMSAGRGVIHSEMPLLDADGLHGFQLWINLPAARKMDLPRYRDVRAAEIVTLSGSGIDFRAIAGHWDTPIGQASGPLPEIGDGAAMADVRLGAGSAIALILPPEQRLLVFVYAGRIENDLDAGILEVWDPGSTVRVETAEGASFLLLRGRPLGEPISHYGPFVMNTPEEIRQAFRDYQAGRLATPPASIG